MPKKGYKMPEEMKLIRSLTLKAKGGNQTSFKKGHIMSVETRLKISMTTKGRKAIKVLYGEESPSWKGEKAGYRALHSWVQNMFGKPRECERCAITTANRYEWSNNSGQYLRVRSDWERLCVPCHRIKDDWINKVARKNKGGESYV